jgi:hypothetical protein
VARSWNIPLRFTFIHSSSLLFRGPYVAYRKKHYNETVTEGDARNQIIDFVESDGFAEFSTKPRVILSSEGFSQEITTTVLWLRSSQIATSCVKMTPYQVAERSLSFRR